MQYASCVVKLTSIGNEVPMSSVTPSEIVLLQEMHGRNAGGIAIHDIKVLGDLDAKMGRKYTTSMEMNRLRKRYGNDDKTKKPRIESLYPGVNPNLPQTFDEVALKPAENVSAMVVEAMKLPGEPGYDEQQSMMYPQDKGLKPETGKVADKSSAFADFKDEVEDEAAVPA